MQKSCHKTRMPERAYALVHACVRTRLCMRVGASAVMPHAWARGSFLCALLHTCCVHSRLRVHARKHLC